MTENTLTQRERKKRSSTEEAFFARAIMLAATRESFMFGFINIK
jgi:hypothetical protein